MNVQRLHTLAKFLRSVPPEKFDLDFWVSVHRKNFTDKAGAEVGEVIDGEMIKASCGMAACAVGWCGSIKEFRDAGFEIRVEPGYGDPRSAIASPVYKGYRDWNAVQSFFEIDIDVADRLFVTDMYQPEEEYEREYDADGEVEHKPTPSEVADRIDELTGRVSTPSRNILLALT